MIHRSAARSVSALAFLVTLGSTSIAAVDLRSRQAVANREGDTVSLVDSADDAEIHLELGEGSEPMYVSSPLGSRQLWIGDRANDRVLLYGTARWRRVAEVPTSDGVFHMWGNSKVGQLWVVCDIDKVLTVVGLEDRRVLSTVPIPADLAADFKPHDVTVTEQRAIVTLIGETDPEVGYLVAYDVVTFDEVGRLEVGGDPHVFHWGLHDSNVYAATQRDGRVLRVDPLTLAVTGELEITGAHGIAANLAETHLYVTNIESDGEDALIVIDLASFTVLDMVDSAVAFPHNVSVSPQGDRLFATHSSTGSSQTTTYDLDELGIPGTGTVLDTGEIPFGINVVLDPQP